MGNIYSIYSSLELLTTPRKPSADILADISRSCHSCSPSFTSAVGSQATFCNEKYSLYHSSLKHTPKSPKRLDDEAAVAYQAFLKEFPEYQLTSTLDDLRESDFSRLDRVGETYVDYMGGALYPESLIRSHSAFLNDNVLGNTHSVSNSSMLSSSCAEEARAAVLSFFQAPPEYTVVFTSNATGALKLVGESYPFTNQSTYVLGVDSHNSVHGIREFATRAGAKVCYIDSTKNGGFVECTAKDVLTHNQPHPSDNTQSLFALTGQSNISNCKNPLSIIEFASSIGYHTLLDAAALAPTSTISLSEYPQLDAMAISCYKMFGFPTGVGALIVKKSFLAKLKRPWFSGGNVDLVQVPGSVVTRAHDIHQQFEDGTINYLTLPAVTAGFQLLSAYLPFLPLRLSSLLHFLTSSLSQLRHEISGTPVVQILSRLPARRLKSVGEQADTGSTVSLIFLFPSGEMMPNKFIEHAATALSISLRTGCMCNPGGAAALLGTEEDMKGMYPGVTRKDIEQVRGQELGVVRISLGLASTFQDVRNVILFARTIGNETSRQILWRRWMENLGVAGRSM